MADDLTDKERELIAKHREAEAKAKAESDESDEVDLQFPDGFGFRGSFKRARGVAASRGYKLEPDPEPKDDGKDDDDKPSGVTRFGRRVS